MVTDAIFRSSLLCLAVILITVGFYTQSFKKTLATYIFGMLAIGGVILPDWEFFDRSISLWCTPLTVDVDHHLSSRSAPIPNQEATPNRFRIYPVRLAVYTTVYAYAFYKWWMFVSS